MQTVADSRIPPVISKPRAYPAPLCEACNVTMSFVGEYGANPGTLRREFHCAMCSAGRIIRRHRRDA